MGFEQCNYCLTDTRDVKLKRCANCKYASALPVIHSTPSHAPSPQGRLLLRQYPQILYNIFEPLNRLPRTHSVTGQSKECQKAHWKTTHKAICSTTSDQNSTESRGEKGWSKKIKRWLDAWTPAIIHCLPVALDLANHEWGRHDTRSYALSLCFSLRFLISSRRYKSRYVDEVHRHRRRLPAVQGQEISHIQTRFRKV